MLALLDPFGDLQERNDELAAVQKIVRREMHDSMNYWDYLIIRQAQSPADLPALRASSKEDIARLFVNRFL